jgi:putative proteasome-type protease
MLLAEGLVMIADTRTNAGVDNFASFKKLHLLCEGEDREIYVATSGSLSVTQSALGLLREGLPPLDGADVPRSLHAAPTMFRAAQMVGEAIQSARGSIRMALADTHVSTDVSFLVGGRIGDDGPRLFLIYSAGNFIECSPDTPFFQIGETKYGKPILDRGLSIAMPLAQAVKVGFLAFDSAMRSNLGVARPLDVLVMPRDRNRAVITRRIEHDDQYFNDLSLRWAEMLYRAAVSIPVPPWMEEEARSEAAE